jgi:hypothetical protein
VFRHAIHGPVGLDSPTWTAILAAASPARATEERIIGNQFAGVRAVIGDLSFD